MKRSIEQWQNMVPEAVARGSDAQITYALKDAQYDIIELFEENLRAAREIREATQRERAAAERARAEGLAAGIERAAKWHDDEADRIRNDPRWDKDYTSAIGDHEEYAESIRALAYEPQPATRGINPDARARE